MSLSAFRPARFTVSVGDDNTPIAVRGLSLTDMAVLVREHLPDLNSLVELFNERRIESSDDFAKIIMSIVSQAPGFAANLIAIASDEPESADVAMTIPAPLQVKLFSEIVRLTFAEVGGIKNGVALVVGLVTEMKTEPEAATTSTPRPKKPSTRHSGSIAG